MPMRHFAAALVLLTLAPLGAVAAPAPAATTTAKARDSAPPLSPEQMGTLSVAGRQILQLAPVGGFSAEARALDALRRVIRILEPEDANAPGIETFDVATDVKAGAQAGTPVVFFKSVPVATVTPADAKALRMSPPQVAAMWASNLRAGLEALNASHPETFRQALEQLTVSKGDQVIATGVSGSSDGMIAERIRRRLAKDPDLQEQDVRIDVSGDEVVIRGTVESDRQERRIETLAGDEAGERHIRSEVTIDPSLQRNR